MPIAQPRPPSPWLQTVSGFFSISGAVSIATKFRQIDNYQATLITNVSTSVGIFSKFPPLVSVSTNKGIIAAQLYYYTSGGGGALTSAAAGVAGITSTGVNIWTTGVM